MASLPWEGNSTGSTYDQWGEEIEREFNPDCNLMRQDVPKSRLVVCNPSKRVSQLQIKHPSTGAISLDRMTVVVSIDGACCGNGTPSARAAWGVYFGPNSPHNDCGLLDPTLPQTSTRAEIEALTDSDYLVKAMSRWIKGWIENGGRKAGGGPVAHFQVLKDIHEFIEEMTYGDEGGLYSKFWHVPRAQNPEADTLANRALDGSVSLMHSRC
ncbi:ribonuclease H-like domain-containing protein [Hypoxylon sp. FL1150]|nr:ribonuclease H-like domain-containing protein [Hypoxylon sp. FL1150]